MNLVLSDKKVIISSYEITFSRTKELIQDILELDRTKGDIYLIINSCGGHKGAGPLFYKSIKNSLKNKLITVATGEIASAATLFYMAGTERYAHKGSYFYVHAGASAEASFPYAESDSVFKSIRLERDDWADMYAKNSNISKQKWIKYIKDSKVFDTKEMLKFGIAHQLIDD